MGTLRENTPILITRAPILITTNKDQVECDSGFDGSPDLKKTDGVRNLQMSLTDREAESPVSFPRQTLTTPKRSSVEEKKTRDKQLLESFLRNENPQIRNTCQRCRTFLLLKNLKRQRSRKTESQKSP